jgi:hypothetical protein
MTTETTENHSALETLVGEGKKFKTAEDLAKGKVEADAFILTLQNQIKELSDELGIANISAERRTALENLMSTLTNTTKTPGETKPGNQPQDPGNQPPKTLSHDDVVKLLEERELNKAAERNKAHAKAQLSKIYGEKTDEVIAKKASELGITVAELEGLAAKSPQLFLNAVGANARDNSTRPMATHSSAIVTGTVEGTDPQMRNKAYYDGLRSKMGALKFVNDRDLQIQRHKDMIALGDAWDA